MFVNTRKAIKWCVIAKELHQDGTPHIHIVVKYNGNIDTNNVNFFDCLCNKHGNYQIVRAEQQCIAYVKKSDPEPLIFGLVPKEGESKDTVTQEIAKLLLGGSTVKDIVLLNPGFSLTNYKKIVEFKSVSDKIRTEKCLVPWSELIIDDSIIDTETDIICCWFNTNCGPGKIRVIKQSNLFIWGPSNYNKTSLVQLVSTRLRIYHVNNNEEFFHGYNDDDYDLIVFDEFKNRPIQVINPLLDNSPCQIRLKGSSVIKQKPTPCVIISNFSPDQLYPNIFNVISHVTLLKTFLNRVMVISLSEPIKIDKIKFC